MPYPTNDPGGCGTTYCTRGFVFYGTIPHDETDARKNAVHDTFASTCPCKDAYTKGRKP